MRYEVKGEGRPLVMIMGLAGSADWWEPETIRALARDFRVLVFDNRDAGRTKGPEAFYTLRDMAADTVGLMDHVGFGRAHVLGISMGGMIAQELALGYPERVDRLVLGCTTPGMVSGVPARSEVLALLAAGRESRSLLRFARDMARIAFSPGWLARHFWRVPGLVIRAARNPARPEGFVRQMSAIGGFEAGDRLPGLKALTLILHGDRDVLLPPENGRRLAELIPGAKLVWFRGAGHAFNSEQPGLFVKTVREFLLA